MPAPKKPSLKKIAVKKPAAKKTAVKAKAKTPAKKYANAKVQAAVEDIQSKFHTCKAVSTSAPAQKLLEGMAEQLFPRQSILSKVPWVLRSKSTLAQSTIKDGVLLGSLKALRSQNNPRFNVCRITATGHFCCCDSHGRLCSKKNKGPCKHLAAVLTRAVIDGHIEASAALKWTQRSLALTADLDKGPLLQVLLSPLQSEAFDWRPTEIIPEDTYAE